MTITSQLLPSDLEQRITALEDRQAITDLIYRYTESIRQQRPKECLDYFTVDALVELRHTDLEQPGHSRLQDRFVGKKEIASSFDKTAGASAHIWPVIHNLRIELDGDQASSCCVMRSVIWPYGKEYVGEYRDTFRRDQGSWKFTARVFTLFGDTEGQYPDAAHASYEAVKR